MLNREERLKLEQLIEAHSEAQVAESWAGAGDPAEAEAIRARAEAAEAKLKLYIEQVTIKE